jgi:hypothetical protein
MEEGRARVSNAVRRDGEVGEQQHERDVRARCWAGRRV